MSLLGEGFLLLPADEMYDMGTSGPVFALSPGTVPVTPEPVQHLRAGTQLVSQMNGPRMWDIPTVTPSPLAFITSPTPPCGCRSCGNREAHHRTALGISFCAFLVLVVLYVTKVR